MQTFVLGVVMPLF